MLAFNHFLIGKVYSVTRKIEDYFFVLDVKPLYVTFPCVIYNLDFTNDLEGVTWEKLLEKKDQKMVIKVSHVLSVVI